MMVYNPFSCNYLMVNSVSIAKHSAWHIARLLKVPVSQSVKLKWAMDLTFLTFKFVMSEFNFYLECFPIPS